MRISFGIEHQPIEVPGRADVVNLRVVERRNRRCRARTLHGRRGTDTHGTSAASRVACGATPGVGSSSSPRRDTRRRRLGRHRIGGARPVAGRQERRTPSGACAQRASTGCRNRRGRRWSAGIESDGGRSSRIEPRLRVRTRGEHGEQREDRDGNRRSASVPCGLVARPCRGAYGARVAATLTDNALQVLRARYLVREEGVVVETPDQLFARVALHVSAAEERLGAAPTRSRRSLPGSSARCARWSSCRTRRPS